MHVAVLDVWHAVRGVPDHRSDQRTTVLGPRMHGDCGRPVHAQHASVDDPNGVVCASKDGDDDPGDAVLQGQPVFVCDDVPEQRGESERRRVQQQPAAGGRAAVCAAATERQRDG